ncbi:MULTISPECIES: hypothetical protein [Haloarcula]|uniref:hypothetical protein n=1 Tax=Haloarcula TaxID=2237 RepID=UPI0023EAFFD6|nr:hypothetical protein [Halomicroarcula sp. XH51]
MAQTTDDPTDLNDFEVDALHSVELGLEWLRRAHGNLIEFHHATGHAMDHLDDAEPVLRACGYDDLADRLRTDLLPSGAVDERWTYDLLETFEDGLLDDVQQFERQASEDIADGDSHVAERRQERAWRRRAERDE